MLGIGLVLVFGCVRLSVTVERETRRIAVQLSDWRHGAV